MACASHEGEPEHAATAASAATDGARPAGGRAASASHVSALIAGTTPLSFALLGALCWGLPVERRRWPALAAIVAGVLLMVAGLDSPGGTPWLGAAWLLLASGMWSAYTHGLRLAGLDPLGGMVVVTYPSLLATLALLGSGLVDSHLDAAPARELWLFGAVQGVAVGLLSTFCYGQSVRLLGPQRSAMTGALAPGQDLEHPMLGSALIEFDRALATLSEAQRHVLLLCYGADLSHADLRYTETPDAAPVICQAFRGLAAGRP